MPLPLMSSKGISLAVPSVAELVTQAFCDELNRFSDAPARAFRSRLDALSSGELPAIVVYSVAQTPVNEAEVMKRMHTVRIEIQASAEPPADAALDPLYVYVIRAIATSDVLGDLTNTVREARLQWDIDGGASDTAVLLLDFDVEFATQQWDPTVAFSAGS